MKSCTLGSFLLDSKGRLYLASFFVSASMICCFYFAGNAFFARDFAIISTFGINGINGSQRLGQCEGKCRPPGSESLPEGIVTTTSNFEMRPLFGDIDKKTRLKHSPSLLAMPVGIKQKELVNEIVQKFLESNFAVILFHYDANVDEWNGLEWSNRVIHISAINQTKWWFAKRFLHPDIVSEYEYIFLWDEDLGVENFHPVRYLSIVREEGLEISQPALDPTKSRVHQQITARKIKSRVHRRYLKLTGGGRCDNNSTAPPCVGWVEMMAPVFSRAAWRCSWYMVQNDLIHAWGLDRQLGYCAQGDRTEKVGVVDEEYVVHVGLPTLGGLLGGNKVDDDSTEHSSEPEKLADSEIVAPPVLNILDNRALVRKQSYIEMKKFKQRWYDAVQKDKCWVDPYPDPPAQKAR